MIMNQREVSTYRVKKLSASFWRAREDTSATISHLDVAALSRAPSSAAPSRSRLAIAADPDANRFEQMSAAARRQTRKSVGVRAYRALLRLEEKRTKRRRRRTQVTVQAENGNSSQVSLYVVDAGVPLLGRDLQEKLKLSVIHGATVCAIKEEQMPEELPSLTGFVHRAADRSGEDRACYLQKFLQTYRSTPHATTVLSPAELLHGRKLRTRLHAAALPTEEPQDRELRDRVQKRQKKQKRYADERRAAETPRFQVGDWVRCRLVPRPKKGRPRYSEPRRVESRLGPVSYRLDDGSWIHAERLTTARAPQQSQAELHVDQSGQPGAGQRSAVSPTSVPRRGERLEADDWRHAEDGVPLEDGQAVSLGVGRRHTEASRGPAEDGVAVSPEDAEDAREREASPPPATERQAEQQDAGVLLSPREAASGAGLVAVEPALQPGARVNSGTQPSLIK
ncbi:hypothetical protein FJT64_003764 [Amphibalanus amphitrite]|uniref:Uncharacterized protein n=1 Tax=Amphibalanus amphitrite TaxID=1232801 RepID=A0A6A4VXJ8_AMPAM|nr:hypothetical protein FJT64_003764 [Amphibalanus amphitrite]